MALYRGPSGHSSAGLPRYGTFVWLSGNPWSRSHSKGVSLLTIMISPSSAKSVCVLVVESVSDTSSLTSAPLPPLRSRSGLRGCRRSYAHRRRVPADFEGSNHVLVDGRVGVQIGHSNGRVLQNGRLDIHALARSAWKGRRHATLGKDSLALNVPAVKTPRIGDDRWVVPVRCARGRDLFLVAYSTGPASLVVLEACASSAVFSFGGKSRPLFCARRRTPAQAFGLNKYADGGGRLQGVRQERDGAVFGPLRRTAHQVPATPGRTRVCPFRTRAV